MSMLNFGRYVELSHQVSVGIQGIYTCRAIKPGFGVVRELNFPNLITNIGMNSLGTGLGWAAMQLGTGTTTPAFTDTALAAYGVGIASAPTSNVNGVSGTSPYYGYRRMTWLSTVGGATGNWTEIGVSSTGTTGNLRSRALIVDNLGNPTTFPVLADEQFQGTYEIRFYAPVSAVNANINLSGTSYTTTTRALRVTDANSWGPGLAGSNPDGLFRPQVGTLNSSSSSPFTGGLAAVTASVPLGTNITSGSATLVGGTYTSDTFYKECGVRYGAGAGVGNINTIQYIMQGGAFQIAYSPVIPKLTTEELITWIRTTWTRI